MPSDRGLLAAGLVLALQFIWTVASSAGASEAPASSNFKVDPKTSQVYVRVDSATRLGHAHGVSGRLSSGVFRFGGAGEFVFDMTSFVADTSAARTFVGLDARFSQSDAQKVNDNMKGPGVLDVARYPLAKLAITSVRPLDSQATGAGGRYQLDGRFTLHGTTHPLSFEAKAEPSKKANVLRLHGSFQISQTAFGIQPYSALGGLIRVADALTIYGDLELVPDPSK
jgi:polyisoprenoid-binding protein YceI